jgi:fructoselysine-6-P-deglycase FrlB-like protein
MLGEHWTGGSTDWSELPALAQHVLDDARATMDEIGAGAADARVVDVVGTGSSAATAGEGALLLRESARLLTAAHDTRNYLHGPMEPLGPEVACLIVGDGREVRLARDTAALGCPTLLLTCAQDVESGGTLTVLRLPRPASALGRAVLEILPIQLLAWSVARRRGLSVDGFRYQQDDTKSGAA